MARNSSSSIKSFASAATSKTSVDRRARGVTFGMRFERTFSEGLHDESDGKDIIAIEEEHEQEKKREKQRLREELRRECGGFVDPVEAGKACIEVDLTADYDDDETEDGSQRSRGRSSAGISSQDLDGFACGADDMDAEADEMSEGRGRARSRGGVNEDELDALNIDDDADEMSEGRSRARSRGGITENELDSLNIGDDPDEMSEGRGRARSRGGINEDELDALNVDDDPDEAEEDEEGSEDIPVDLGMRMVDSLNVRKKHDGANQSEVLDAPKMGDRLQVLPGKEFIGKSGFGLFKADDCGVVISSFVTIQQAPMMVIAWELTGRRSFMAMSIWQKWVKVIEKAPHIGDRLQCLEGKAILDKSGVQLFKTDDYGVVTSSYVTDEGTSMMTIAWERTGRASFMAMSIWPQWVRVVSKAPQIGDRLQALADKEFLGKSGNALFKSDDYGVVRSRYTDASGQPKMTIIWERSQKTGFMTMSAWPQWVEVVQPPRA